MNATKLLTTLIRRGVELQVKNGELRYRAPKGTITPDLQEELAVHKAAIIGRLAENRRYLQCSFAQERLWFLNRLDPAETVYNVPLALRLNGALDRQALTAALSALVARHEILRTTFEAVGDAPVQVIHPPVEQSLTVAELPEGNDGEQEAVRWLEETANRPFDLHNGPLFQAFLLQANPETHFLLLNMHHIVTDGWSVDVLLRELTTLYKAFCQGQATPLSPLPLQYSHYTQWQRSWLQGDVLAEKLDYWKRQLSGQPELLALTTDYHRPDDPTYDGSRHSHPLPNNLSAALQKLSQDEGATLFMTLLAAFQLLLYRYTGQADIPVGTPIANRKAETEGLVGFFVNTLVLRGRLSSQLTFRQFLQQVKETALEAYVEQDLPFERLVEALQPRRLINHNPLFQVFFAFEKWADKKFNLPNLTVAPLEISSRTTKFDLSLTIADKDSTLTAVITYNTHLFAPETIQRMMDHLETLLLAVTAAPDRPLADFSLLTANEVQQISGSDQIIDFSTEDCLHHLFERQALNAPDAVALSFGGETLTYRELNEQANRLAHFLQAQEIGPEKLAAVCMNRTPTMVVSLLAILKTGGAYVPLDPAYPAERIAFMLADSNASLLLTEQRLQNKLPASADGIPVVAVDAPDGPLATKDKPFSADCNPSNLAYIIYTSGSTGRPKGVAITHRSAVAFAAWTAEVFQPQDFANVLASTSICFDLSIFELFATLAQGGTIVLAEDALHLPGLPEAAQVTMINTVPSAMKALIQNGSLPASVRTVNLAGEPLKNSLVQAVYQQSSVERVFNLYGPSEDTTYSTFSLIEKGSQTEPTIGRPIANTQAYLLDKDLQPVPVGQIGELYLGGDGLARGYLRRAGLTAERFLSNPFSQESGQRMYKTGDLARYQPDGRLEFLGRADQQVKIRGFRIELGEIEVVLGRHPQVREAVVMAREGQDGEKQLAAYVVRKGEEKLPAHALRQFLHQHLPDYMVPSFFINLDSLPLTPNGKIDKLALPEPERDRPELETAHIPPQTKLERLIAAIWQDVLQLDAVGINDNFFDLGGHSLLLVQVHIRLQEQLDRPISQLDLLKYPTIRSLARYLNPTEAETKTADKPGPRARRQTAVSDITGRPNDIAIIGMSGRWPGAPNVAQFWQNLCDGVESVTFFDDETLIAAGVDPQFLAEPNYVKARATLEGYDLFDAPFFGYTPREAEFTDPQQRIFLEAAWEALESAGYAPGSPQRVGVYAGASLSSYLLSQVWANRSLLRTIGSFQALIGNDSNFLTTRVSYKLDLNGPSIGVQTACSTSLVATHLACRSLLNDECDIALSGGISVDAPQENGYFYHEGNIDSPDGHCRVFDAEAKGTISGSGVGVVVLKRLEQALADGDTVLAVIKGSAINNDGAFKVGYTAPSVDGQASVIRAAQEAAGVTAESIRYVEAHGTATPLGDPIEIVALTQAFAGEVDEKAHCAVGSVKSNVGHLDVAAGVTGLIKTVLTLQNGVIPPSLHFQQPNPKIDFANSPFYVNAKLSPWPEDSEPRRAGVSSFGIGGTNAHIILEEAPKLPETDPGKPWQLLILSAKTAAALEAASDNLANYLAQTPNVNLADVAYTLQCGRRPFNHRRIILAKDMSDAAETLAARDLKRVLSFAHPGLSSQADVGEKKAVFLFPGQGTQYANMASDLYQAEPVFREQVDACAALLEPYLEYDLRDLIFPNDEAENGNEPLTQTANAQLSLFVIEYALARLWQHWGIRPEAMLGHSIGEYVAACLAGVFSLEQALEIVLLRGRLMEAQPAGAMLAVSLPEDELASYLTDGLTTAVINGPEMCVVSGSFEAIDALEKQLNEQGVKARRLHTSHAFHSPLMEGAVQPFQEYLEQINLKPPQIPFLSNVSGDWITEAQATDPAYWAGHIRQPVRFGEGLQRLFEQPDWLLLEVGPGVTLAGLARQQQSADNGRFILSSLPHPQERQSDYLFLLTTLGRLWLAGVPVDWSQCYTDERRRRIPLPTYPFERKRYWIDAPRAVSEQNGRTLSNEPIPQLSPDEAQTPEPELNGHQRPNLQNAFVAPRNAVESRLAAIWQEHLGIKTIGIHDNFFELGGHSLLATQIVAQIREAFQIEMPLSLLFELPTIADMAQKVADDDSKVGDAIGVPASIIPTVQTESNAISPAPRQGQLPLSASQERQWFLDQFEPGASTYNIPAIYHLDGQIDLEALTKSFQTLIERHESLRTNFVAIDGRPAQVIHSDRPFTFTAVNANGNDHSPQAPNPVFDLRSLPIEQRQAAALQLVETEVQKPFNLSDGALMRAALLHLDNDRHMLAVTMHHIISDGWSLNVLIRELTTLYQEFVTGQQAELSPLPIQYADFAAWQRQWLESGECQRQVEYWQRQLAGAPPLQLPTDRPRSNTRTYRVTRKRLTLPADQVAALRQLSNQEGATLFMTLLAAFKLLLHHYTRQDDICVGSFIANRNRPDTQNLIGFFVNNLAFRTDLSGNPNGRDLIRRVRQTALNAYANQDLPFEKVLEVVRPERTLSHAPIFQVMCVLQNFPQAAAGLSGLAFSPAGMENNKSDFDLTLWMQEKDTGLIVEFEYNPDLFDETTIARMQSHFQRLLVGITADPDQRIGELPLPEEQEWQRLQQWSVSPYDFSTPNSLAHQLFEAQAAQTPQATAVIHQEEQLTYEQLNHKANQLAHLLQEQGVGPDSRVGIYLERSLDLVVAMLAVLKAGGAYVPLDPRYPARRTADILADVQAKLLLTNQPLLSTLELQESSPGILFLDEAQADVSQQPTDNLAAVAADNLAYVIYTSGSTGKPKGVAISHAALVNYVVGAARSFAITPTDRVLQFASISFDTAAEEIYPCLISGATLVLRTDAMLGSEQAFVEQCRAWEISILDLPTAYWHQLTEGLIAKGLALPPQLRLVIIGGERALPERIAVWQERFGQTVALYNTYGPTETTVVATSALLTGGEQTFVEAPIGRPVANNQAYVLNRYLQPVPAGLAGELYIGGRGLARGYWGQSGMTADRFIPDPFGEQAGGRLYRTGDLVRYRPDGQLEFLGRVDQQVKIRGYRVEPAEIENCLMQHSSIREAVILVREEKSGQPRLAAYLVPTQSSPSNGDNGAELAEVIRAFARKELPDYMVPADYVILEALPLTPSGKIDRHALPEPTMLLSQNADHVAPQTPEEELLVDIWADMLEQDQVSVYDNFFDLGGHSLLATQLISRIRDHFNVELPLQKLFENPTVAALAVAIEDALLAQIEELSEEEVAQLMELVNGD